MLDDLIIWAQGLDRRQKLERLLADQLTPEVKRRLRRMDPETFYTDDLAWLDEAAWSGPFSLPVEFILAERLLGWRVRTFHACRPQNVASYLRQGLRKLRAAEAIRELRRLVGKHSCLTGLRDAEAFAAALGKVDRLGRVGHVYTSIDDRPLQEDCGHYLIYGSEYTSAVLAQAGGQWFQHVLKTEGIPTVFIVDLPLRLVSDSDLGQFCNLLLAEWAKGVVRRRQAAPYEDFSFDLAIDIPAACIAGHYHPTRVRDPLLRFAWYVNSATTCPYC